VENRLNPTNLGQVCAGVRKLNPLRVPDGVLATFGFKLWVLGSFLEKVFVCSIQVSKFLLQDLGVSFFEPFSIAFFYYKIGNGVMCRQPFTSEFVIRFSISQSLVVNIPSVAKLDSQQMLLLFGWVHTVFSGLADEHYYLPF
jgi:hypothetical protein